MALTVDDILERIGSLGLYQIRLILILSYIEWFNMTFQVMVPTVIAAEPNWMCAANHNACNFTGTFKPSDKRRCSMPREAWKFTDDFTSVVTQFDLVCDHAVLSSLSTSLVFAGWLFGALLGGVLSDKIGRKPVLVLFAFTTSVFGLLASFPHKFWLFILFRLCTGLSIGGGSMGLYVMATEFVGRRHRHIAGNSLFYAWTLALVMQAGLAYGVRDWRILSIICADPGLPVLIAWRYIPESTRYLLLKGKVAETEEILRDIATTNKEYPNEPLFNPSADGKVQQMGDVRDLFRTKKMLHRTLVSWYAWFLNALVYYGVSFSTPTLGGNMYLNFFLSSVIEIPANYVAIWSLGRFGRKKPLVYCMVLAAIASTGAVLCTMYDPGDDKGFMAGRIIMALLAKFFVFISFDAVYLYAAELFPTVIRNIGMGTSTAAGRIVLNEVAKRMQHLDSSGFWTKIYPESLDNVPAPYWFAQKMALDRLTTVSDNLLAFPGLPRLVHPLLPYGIMGINALLAGLLCMTLPETKGTPTAETVDSEEGAEEAYVALQTSYGEKSVEEKTDLTMEDTVKDITSSRAHLVDGELHTVM